MPCDTVLRRRNQTLSERKAEVKKAVDSLDRQLLKKKVKPVVGPQGAITFQGWKEEDKEGVSDACAYRRIMATGSSLAKAEISRAEQLAGRAVDKKILTTGLHSHDGGDTWGTD